MTLSFVGFMQPELEVQTGKLDDGGVIQLCLINRWLDRSGC